MFRIKMLIINNKLRIFFNNLSKFFFCYFQVLSYQSTNSQIYFCLKFVTFKTKKRSANINQNDPKTAENER